MWLLLLIVISKYVWFLKLMGHSDKKRTMLLPMSQVHSHMTFQEVLCPLALSLLGKTEITIELRFVKKYWQITQHTLGSWSCWALLWVLFLIECWDQSRLCLPVCQWVSTLFIHPHFSFIFHGETSRHGGAMSHLGLSSVSGVCLLPEFKQMLQALRLGFSWNYGSDVQLSEVVGVSRSGSW